MKLTLSINLYAFFILILSDAKMTGDGCLEWQVEIRVKAYSFPLGQKQKKWYINVFQIQFANKVNLPEHNAIFAPFGPVCSAKGNQPELKSCK
jgi:hypothetical protein